MISSDIPGPPSATSRSPTRIALISVVVLLLIAAPIAGALAWELAREGNTKVTKKWGAITGTVFGPGAHFINPILQPASSLSVWPQSHAVSPSTNEGDRRGDDAITVLSEDGLWTGIDMTAHYRIDTGQAVELYRNYRTLATTEECLIRPSIRSVLRTGAGRLSITVIYTGESQTQLKIAVERELAEELADDGLVLEAMQVRNIELPAEYTQAVEREGIAERCRQQK